MGRVPRVIGSFLESVPGFVACVSLAAVCFAVFMSSIHKITAILWEISVKSCNFAENQTNSKSRSWYDAMMHFVSRC